MNIKLKMACVGAGLSLLMGCQSTGELNNADRNQFVTEFYAFVQHVEAVQFESHVEEAMATGAFIGALENSDGDRGDIIGGAVVGGFLSGLLTSIFEGSTKGYEYQLHAIDGDFVTVVSDHFAADLGDCVKVRVAGQVTIEKRPLDFCQYEEEYLEE